MRRSRHRFLAVLCATGAAVLFAQGARGGGGTSPASDWLSAAQRRAAADEYNVTWESRTALPDAAASWQAPNRAHGFRTHFTGAGIRLLPRTEAEPSWRWGLELTGYGRGLRLWRIAEAVPLPEGNRVDYWRGAITEWYVNEPRGLEQGFTVLVPPEDTPDAERAPRTAAAPSNVRVTEDAAYLELTLSGTLQPSLSGDGQAVDFRTQRGESVVRYAALRVTDAAGRDLPSWIEVWSATRSRGIRLVFVDREAVYPLTVDPLVTSPSWSADGDQDSARFGYSVGTAGHVNDDDFDDLVVGAPWYDNGQVDEGRVYVYLGSEGGLSAEPDWTAEGDQAGARFGYAVGTAGDVDGDGYDDVIVGAPWYDDGELGDAGRAYVFLGSEGGLSAEPDWTAEGDQAGARFGFSVGTAGDVDSDGYDDVIIGAPLYDGDGTTDEGRAYVYLHSGEGLSTEPAWTASCGQTGANFGHAVGTAGDVNADGYDDVAVGAPLYDDGETTTDAGRVWVFHGSAGGPAETRNWEVASGQAYANLGSALGTAGDVNGDGVGDFIVGAFHYADGEAGEGRAWVFHGVTGTGLRGALQDAAWTAESDQAWAYFGAAVATAGDVNNDGYDDVIVGAYGYNSYANDAGRIYLFQGQGSSDEDESSGLTAFPVWYVDGDLTGAGLGAAVGTAGDVNGDGYADVVAGAPYYYADEPHAGRAVVYHGAETIEASTLCAYLGDAAPIEVEEDVFEDADLDQDVFTFRGTETEEVTVTLSAQDASDEGRATLIVMDEMGDTVQFFEVDRSELPNEITVALPASGDYVIAVAEQPDIVILPGVSFRGGYCVTLDSEWGAAGTLEATDSVEQEESAAATEPTPADAGTDDGAQPARRPRSEARRRPTVR